MISYACTCGAGVLIETCFIAGISFSVWARPIQECFLIHTTQQRFILKGPIDTKSSMVHVIAWHRAGDKLLLEPMLPTFYDATGLQWVKSKYSWISSQTVISKISMKDTPLFIHEFNSLAPGRYNRNFRYLIFNLISIIGGRGISCKMTLRWLSLDLNDDKSTLVQVMAWCRQATSHYLSQCWPISMPLYGHNELRYEVSFVNSNSDLCSLSVTALPCSILHYNVTHWGKHKMATNLQKTFSNSVSWMKLFVFWIKLHWNLFPRVQLTISQHWFR